MPYPPEIKKQLASLRHAKVVKCNAIGTEANFSCGCSVRIYLSVDAFKQKIKSLCFTSNGCGWMVAAAELLCKSLSRKQLSDLRGLNSDESTARFNQVFGAIAQERNSCVAAPVAAIQLAFADYRSRQIEEFQGEKALICTCFGVTEETINSTIETENLRTVEAVSTSCNAGSGCGSCRMLIQEILDGVV